MSCLVRCPCCRCATLVVRGKSELCDVSPGEDDDADADVVRDGPDHG